jgi:hypothetical protein
LANAGKLHFMLDKKNPSSAHLLIYSRPILYTLRVIDITLKINRKLLNDSSVDIATRYGLGGLGIESRWGRDFPHPSRPALGPKQPPVPWVPGLYRGQGGRGVVLTTHPI